MPYAPALGPSVDGEGVAEGAAVLHWEGVVGIRAFPAATGALANSAAAAVALGCVADQAAVPPAHPGSWDAAPRGHIMSCKAPEPNQKLCRQKITFCQENLFAVCDFILGRVRTEIFTGPVG